MRYFLAIAIVRLLHFLLVKFSLGGGMTLPGRVAVKICPDILKHLAKKFVKVVLITGVNGKTTTARLIAQGLSSRGEEDLTSFNGLKVVQNRMGNNILWGIVSTAALAPKKSFALLEVDEASLPRIANQLLPSLILFHNLSRDQLDRYGEIDNIWKGWVKTVKSLPKQCKIVVNADDPFCASLAKYAKGKVVTYGVNDLTVMSKSRPAYADARLCMFCGEPLKYKKVLISHSGHFYCEKCGFARQKPDVTAISLYAGVAFEGDERDYTVLKINYKNSNYVVAVPLVGIFNAINVLAALAVLTQLEVNLKAAITNFANFSVAFGRFEKIKADAKFIELVLIKNPAGATEVLKIFEKRKNDGMVIAINDQLADGTDVSWLWDTEFERIAKSSPFFIVTGIRAEDMALRLKYADVSQERIFIEKDFNKAIKEGLSKVKEGSTLEFLATYSAMLSVKKLLARKGWGKNYWSD